MGEKPTAEDERKAGEGRQEEQRGAGAGAGAALRESPTRASTGREAGSGLATGRMADVDEDGSPDIAIGDPGTNENRQKLWQTANFREGAGGEAGAGDIAIDEEGDEQRQKSWLPANFKGPDLREGAGGGGGSGGIAVNEEGIGGVTGGDLDGDGRADRAVSPQGQTDPTPAQRSWAVDTTPPDTNARSNLNLGKTNAPD